MLGLDISTKIEIEDCEISRASEQSRPRSNEVEE